MLERLDALPTTCPACGRDNSRRTYQNSGGLPASGLGWHRYTRVPGAPAAGCGACGHVVFITEDASERLKAMVAIELPKAAAGKVTKRGRR